MRINIIEPRLLADQHLVAEYREIKMLPKSLLRTINSKSGFDVKKISKKYTLNKGHGYFFYNKLSFIIKRFNDLLKEMEYRKFQTNFKEIPMENIPINLHNDYQPNKDEMIVNIERIKLRISDKPNWYKYFGKILTENEWNELYIIK